MVAYLFLGIALLIGFILLGRWFVTADVKTVSKTIKVLAVILGILFLVYLMLSGRWTLLPMIMFVLLPWIRRLRGLQQTLGGFGRSRPSPGQASAVETEFLRMELDHDSGEMDGDVIAGRFAGRRLAEMSLSDLLALLDECRPGDPQSARVLETYLDRIHGSDWRARAAGGGAHTGGDQAMTREEAFEILGLAPGVGEDKIKEAYHRLIGRLHPDKGGSNYLAAKLNRARDVLLGG